METSEEPAQADYPKPPSNRAETEPAAKLCEAVGVVADLCASYASRRPRFPSIGPNEDERAPVIRMPPFVVLADPALRLVQGAGIVEGLAGMDDSSSMIQLPATISTCCCVPRLVSQRRRFL